MVQSATDENSRGLARRGGGDVGQSPGAHRRQSGFSTAGILLLAAASAVFPALQAAAQKAPQGGAALPAIPVSTAQSERQDVPVWLRGLGTVQARNMVTVRTRVDGTLDKVPVTEGQLVKQGTLLSVIDSRPYQASLDAVLAKKAQDEAQLANARLDLARYTNLAKRDFASRQQVDTQTAMVNQFTAALKGDDAAIETAQLNLSFCYITAPFDGRVGLRLVDPGNMLHAADPGGIVTLTQVHPITVVFTLPQRVLPAVVDAMGQRQLVVAAWSSDDKMPLAQGTLLTPDNAIDTSTGQIRLKAMFPNQDDKLWPGQFVEARLLLRTEQQKVTVPTQAVQHGPGGLYVYMVQPDATVQRQAIEAVDRGPVMVVTKGLDAGQTIVLDGQSRLDNGSHIAATAAAPQAAARSAQAGG
jgi:multidrug efflux system membrane fusion protein